MSGCRRRPRNASRQISHRSPRHRRARRPCPSTRQPRLPMNIPRARLASTTPNGVTRFGSGTGSLHALQEGAILHENAAALLGATHALDVVAVLGEPLAVLL